MAASRIKSTASASGGGSKLAKCRQVLMSFQILIALMIVLAEARRIPNSDVSSSDLMQGSQTRPVASSVAAKYGGQAIWSDLEGWRRNKRDIEDRLVLASRRAAIQRRQAGADKQGKDEDFAIDDGDEDAWVHDGVDDIHIDPETKRAASELSHDEGKTIDAEYDPNSGAGGDGGGGSGGGQESESPPVVNRTRVTTISEVIPMNSDDLDSTSPSRAATISRPHSAAPWSGQRIQMVASAASPHGPLLPASYLTLEQVQRLIDAQNQDKQGNEEEQEED